MKKYYFLIIFYAFSIHSVSAQEANINPANKVYSRQDLQEDFTVLRNRYEQSLANLYLYTSKYKLDKLFDSLYENIDPMSAQQFYNYITVLSGVIKDGHSNIFPAAETTSYLHSQTKYFPFDIYWHRKTMFISANLSGDTSLSAGSEILFINDEPADSIMQYMISHQVRDGYNENYALWILNHYFREYYSYLFGNPDSFFFQLKDRNGFIRSVIVPAVSLNELGNRRTALKYSTAPKDKDGIFLTVDSNQNFAVLTIKSWDRKLLKTRYHQKFKPEIDKAFAAIQKQDIKNLIIDLRDNQGGNAAYGIYLLSLLLNQPFEYFTRIESVTGSNDSAQIVKEEKGNMPGIHKPKKNNFTGSVYVLTNGGSFSNSAAFCSRIEYYKRGIMAGEETGGNKVVFSGEFGAKSFITLPNTKIICENTNYRMTVTDINQNSGRGILPSYEADISIADILQGKDSILSTVTELIRNK